MKDKSIVMADIISFTSKSKQQKTRHQASLTKRKRITVQKLIACNRCNVKCDKCGAQTNGNHDQPPKRSLYRFCDTCEADYKDYIDMLKGRPTACFWHNDAWLRHWACWIEYQNTIDNYMKSKEFKQLVRELDTGGIDE